MEKSYFCKKIISMKERINWIDWAKSIAITLVVMGHLPMNQAHPLTTYINCFHMPLFMFLSGYLTKRSVSFRENLNKDWTGIILPFILYNIVMYPYWAIKAYTLGTPLTLTNYLIDPILGVVSLSLLHGLLNGPTWFLIALFFSRFLIDISNRIRYCNAFLIISSILLYGFYITNEHFLFTKIIVVIGFARCFIFFLIGYYLKGKIIVSSFNKKQIISIVLLTGFISITTLTFLPNILNYSFYIASKQIICVCAIILVVCICMLLDAIRWKIIVNISIGTLVIFGLHWACIGSINMIFQHLLGKEHIHYSSLEVLLLAIFIEIILYPLILKLPPMWIGKRKEIAKLIK